MARHVGGWAKPPQAPQAVGRFVADRIAPCLECRPEGRWVDSTQGDVDWMAARELMQSVKHLADDLADELVAA